MGAVSLILPELDIPFETRTEAWFKAETKAVRDAAAAITNGKKNAARIADSLPELRFYVQEHGEDWSAYCLRRSGLARAAANVEDLFNEVASAAQRRRFARAALVQAMPAAKNEGAPKGNNHNPDGRNQYAKEVNKTREGDGLVDLRGVPRKQPGPNTHARIIAQVKREILAGNEGARNALAAFERDEISAAEMKRRAGIGAAPGTNSPAAPQSARNEEILRLHKEGLSGLEIAARVGCSDSTVSKVKQQLGITEPGEPRGHRRNRNPLEGLTRWATEFTDAFNLALIQGIPSGSTSAQRKELGKLLNGLRNRVNDLIRRLDATGSKEVTNGKLEETQTIDADPGSALQQGPRREEGASHQ